MKDYDKIIMDTEKHIKAVSDLTFRSLRDTMVEEYNKAIEGLNELSDIIEGLQDEIETLNTLLEAKDDTIEFLNHAIRDYETEYPEFAYYRHDHPEFDWIGGEYYDDYDDGK